MSGLNCHSPVCRLLKLDTPKSHPAGIELALQPLRKLPGRRPALQHRGLARMLRDALRT